jgi:hypothetical protein
MTRTEVNQRIIAIGVKSSHGYAGIKVSLRSHRKSLLGEFQRQLLTCTQRSLRHRSMVERVIDGSRYTSTPGLSFRTLEHGLLYHKNTDRVSL